MSKDYRVSDDPNWQPYRDPQTGDVVILTEVQCQAIWKALSVYWQVVHAEVDKHSNPNPAFDIDVIAQIRTASKSCLLGRLLYEGKAPLVDAPPTSGAAPDYSVERPS